MGRILTREQTLKYLNNLKHQDNSVELDSVIKYVTAWDKFFREVFSSNSTTFTAQELFRIYRGIVDKPDVAITFESETDDAW